MFLRLQCKGRSGHTRDNADNGRAPGVVRRYGPLALDLSRAHGALLDHDVHVDLGRILGGVHLLRVHLREKAGPDSMVYAGNSTLLIQRHSLMLHGFKLHSE